MALPGGRGYPILLGEGLLGAADSLAPYVSRQVLVVSNSTVANLYLDQLRPSLGSAAQVHCVEIGDGEQFKTLATYAAILDALIGARFHRNATVLALGGGVVGDVAGFAAATYQRGVALVQIPTTLLALVDSSVGGKTAVNHVAGKNLIGAFYQPRAVLADVATLRTLPMREYRAGLAEVVKYGVIADVEFFAWLEAHVDALMARDAAALLHVVRRCCQIKAAVVAADEREQGRRAILNFGHTFGHAIETLTGFRYLHGEASGGGHGDGDGAISAAWPCRRTGRQPCTAFAGCRGLGVAGGRRRTASHVDDHGHGQESVRRPTAPRGLRCLGQCFGYCACAAR